jgi:hypothetical protein
MMGVEKNPKACESLGDTTHKSTREGAVTDHPILPYGTLYGPETETGALIAVRFHVVSYLFLLRS